MPVRADLLVVDLGGIGDHAGIAVVPGDAEAEVTIVPAGRRAQADVVAVAGSVDRGEEAARQQVCAGQEQRVDPTVGVVPPLGDQGVVVGPDLGDVLRRFPAGPGEVAADIGVPAVLGQGDGVHVALDLGVPRRDLVRSLRAEAEGAASRVGGSALADLGEPAHRVHGAATLHELPDYLFLLPARYQLGGAYGGIRRDVVGRGRRGLISGRPGIGGAGCRSRGWGNYISDDRKRGSACPVPYQ